jgi:tetratricopeptide (TPR) repeat protein
VANTSVAVLREGQPSPEQIARVESWLLAAVEKDPNGVRPALHLADLRDYQGRYDEAEAIYRQILMRKPGSVMALNNLAWLVALRDRRRGQEGLGLIDRALEEAGPVAELLDTRAVIHLAMGNPTDAISDLTRALGESATDRFHLHLAQAQAAAGDRDAARRSLEQARAAGFQESSLHPLERPVYDRLLEQLGGTPTALK